MCLLKCFPEIQLKIVKAKICGDLGVANPKIYDVLDVLQILKFMGDLAIQSDRAQGYTPIGGHPTNEKKNSVIHLIYFPEKTSKECNNS